MKILYLCPWPLKNVDFSAHEYPKTEFGYYTMKRKGIDIIPYAPERWRGVIKKCPSILSPVITQIGCLFHQKHIDVIYVGFDMHLLPLALARMLRLCKVPIFVLSHFTYNPHYTNHKLKRIYKSIERKIVFKYLDKLSFASQTLLDIAMEAGCVPIRHQNVANWGATLDFFNKKMYKKQPTESFFCAAGGMNRDYNTLIQVFEKMTFAECHIWGKYRDWTKDKVIPSNVHFIYNDEKNTYVETYQKLRDDYYNCKAILLPIDYLNDVPNGATVLVEALAMGKPIIITKSETNYIDVEKEGCGLTVQPHDVNDWVRVLTYLMEHPEECKRMGEKSYLLAQSKYNDDVFTNTIYSQIRELVGLKK